MKPNQIMLIAVAALATPAIVAAQSSATADAQAQAQAQARTPKARLDAAMHAAARAQIPASLLESKIAEGEAKRVPQERIATAVETRLQTLITASQTMKRAQVENVSAAELSVAADALTAGVSQNALINVSRNAPAERRVVAIAVLADLVRLGQQTEPAVARVNAALTSNTALANLQADVLSQLRLGGLPSTLEAAGAVRIR